jgi:predicted AlkP superfamily phosphohydrolase/phosphomutase
MPGKEYQLVRDEIMQKLNNLYDPQKERSVNGTVYSKEEWYHGDCSCNAPDITYIAHAGRYQAGNVTGFGANTTFTDFTGVSAAHSMDGIFMASGAHIKRGATVQGADIMDLAPTILYLMGCKVPDDMDGKVLVDLFDGAYLKNKPVEYYTPEAYAKGTSNAISLGDQEEIIDKLKSLGYYQQR